MGRSTPLETDAAGTHICPPSTGPGVLHITGVKRSAFGRLSGRQRPEADEVEGGAKRQRPGNGRSHNKPLRGLLRSLFSTPSAKGERGLPTRHSLRERRLPLDVIRNCPPAKTNGGVGACVVCSVALHSGAKPNHRSQPARTSTTKSHFTLPSRILDSRHQPFCQIGLGRGTAGI